jgi:hypothetical protein
LWRPNRRVRVIVWRVPSSFVEEAESVRACATTSGGGGAMGGKRANLRKKSCCSSESTKRSSVTVVCGERTTRGESPEFSPYDTRQKDLGYRKLQSDSQTVHCSALLLCYSSTPSTQPYQAHTQNPKPKTQNPKPKTLDRIP